MKKIYTYLLLSATLVLPALNACATIWNITVNSFSFSPNTIPDVACGDTVKWTYGSGNPHTTTSTTIPVGANPWNAPINSTNTLFQYHVPNIPGVYNYECATHGFLGSFTVTCAAGINDPGKSIASAVYPNPFASSITFRNYNADTARITDMTGRVIKTISLNILADVAEINLDLLAPGIYFLTTSKEGVIRETKRIVKAK